MEVGDCIINFAQSRLPPPPLSPPQGMLNHWDHVDESQLCFLHTHACVAHLFSHVTVTCSVKLDWTFLYNDCLKIVRL